ncbi:MAG TPA: Mur ligase domain-containing protein [Dissulfurispiraceae bacterium]|nr:Mur ligase domain-containing protein [Dissulfurispiraceae bacterium]
MLNKKLNIFFSGIGGSGVSAIAVFMADKGHMISGSDRAFDNNPNHPTCIALKNKGIAIIPQDGSGITKSLDLVVFSTAVEPDKPEYSKARLMNIPIMTRPEFLAQIVAEYKTIAIAGTSGKSTVSGMLAYLMTRLGLEPNFIGGGRVKQFKNASNPGNSIAGRSDLLVIEACESDGTIVNYRPEHSVILNLDLDHHAVDKTAAMFDALLENTRGKIVINADDSHLAALSSLRAKDAAKFGISQPAKYKATNVMYDNFSTKFSLSGQVFRLSLPGEYNLSNALACIALLSEIGMQYKDIAGVLPDFSGIERRFDVHLDDGTRLVIDDYAHNPHKITALMSAVRPLRGKICYIFQPHGFGPTRLMKDGYIDAFSRGLRNSDHLILLPIYYAGGTADKDISSNDLALGIVKNGKSAESVKDRNEVIRGLDKWDNYVVMGARDDTLSAFTRSIALLLGLD